MIDAEQLSKNFGFKTTPWEDVDPYEDDFGELRLFDPQEGFYVYENEYLKLRVRPLE